MRVLGVCGAPQLGNTHVLVQAALLGAEAVAGVETRYVSLAGKTITPCDGCDACLEAGHCVIDDDMQPLYDELLAADALIIGTSIYFGAPTALCKAFLERLQGFGVEEKRMRLKVGGAIAVGAGRNCGLESTLASLHLWFHINDMLPVGVTTPAPSWGVAGQAQFVGDIDDDVHRAPRLGLEVGAREVAWLYGRKIATVTAIVKAGIEATGLDLPDMPYGNNLPESFPDALKVL
jgi:multimeric flavodoxin WrbA